MKSIAAEGIKRLSVTDKAYPANLRYIFDPPSPLYIRGNILPEDNIAVAIVGSRLATYYGLKNSEGIAFALASRGITVVSGLARGIDSAAHRGALKAGGRTIAVLGSGLNIIYPYENKKLAQEVACNGAVVSEYPQDTPPYRHNFPRRNRIISGLCLGIVVVEAARRSGALITAGCALEQGREVFALPGKVDSFTSSGTHSLIKDGAKLVESIEDIIEELEPLRLWQKPDSGKGQEDAGKSELTAGLTVEEQRIYSALSSEPIHLDEITTKAGLPYGKLLTALLRLQHRKLVKELPGKQFIKY